MDPFESLLQQLKLSSYLNPSSIKQLTLASTTINKHLYAHYEKYFTFGLSYEEDDIL